MVPGTSLAGALRSWLGSVTAPGGGAMFDPGDLGAVFGDLEDGMVCRIMVDDAVAVGSATASIRDGVGIDRCTGSAAAGVLYQSEVVPPGTRFASQDHRHADRPLIPNGSASRWTCWCEPSPPGAWRSAPPAPGDWARSG